MTRVGDAEQRWPVPDRVSRVPARLRVAGFSAEIEQVILNEIQATSLPPACADRHQVLISLEVAILELQGVFAPLGPALERTLLLQLRHLVVPHAARHVLHFQGALVLGRR